MCEPLFVVGAHLAFAASASVLGGTPPFLITWKGSAFAK